MFGVVVVGIVVIFGWMNEDCIYDICFILLVSVSVLLVVVVIGFVLFGWMIVLVVLFVVVGLLLFGEWVGDFCLECSVWGFGFFVVLILLVCVLLDDVI